MTQQSQNICNQKKIKVEVMMIIGQGINPMKMMM